MSIRRIGTCLSGLALTMLAACAEERKERVVERTVCEQIAALDAASRRASFELDFITAETRAREIVAIYDSEPEAKACRDVLGHGPALASLGLALSSQRRFRLAEASFQRAARVLEADALSAGTTGLSAERLSLERAQVNALLSQHWLNRGEFERAEAASDAALDDLQLGDLGIGESVDSRLLTLAADDRIRQLVNAVTRYSQAAARGRSGDLTGAEVATDEALMAADLVEGGTPALRSRFETEQAFSRLQAGDAESAARLARGAADQLDRELPNTLLAARARLLEGVAEARNGNNAAAKRAYAQALGIYGENPGELRYESIWPYIELHLDEAGGDEGDRALAEAVLLSSQLVRSPAAVADIAERAALFAAGDGEGGRSVREWRAASEELAALRVALSRRDLQEFEREALNRRVIDAAQREERLRQDRDELAPGFAEAIGRPVTLDTVQATLRPGEGMLQILAGSPRSTLLLITPDASRVVTIEQSATFLTQAVRILRRPMVPGPDGRYPGFSVALAREIYRLLLGQLDEDLAALDRVFIASNGAVQALPFEMLVTGDWDQDAVASGDYSRVPWFDDRTVIGYLPAARNIVDLRRGDGRLAPSRDFIAFGDYRPGRDPAGGIDEDLRQTCAAEVANIRALGALDSSRDELEAIRSRFGGAGRLVSGPDFTESAVKGLSAQGELSDYRIVHFSTHGLLWETVECFEPALTTTPAPGSTEDGLLQASEIRSLDLAAELVVLSACQTTDPSLGEAGESLSGLAQAFFTSGAESVVASHWLVEDERTAILMRAFYDRLAGEGGYDRALSEARRAVRRDPRNSHPVFWAPFVIVGAGTTGTPA